MDLLIRNHKFHYEMENICRLFFPFEKINVWRQAPEVPAEQTVYTERIDDAGAALLRVGFSLSGEKAHADCRVDRLTPDFERECEREMAVALYTLLSSFCGVAPPWGILTGVRPLGWMRRLAAQHGEPQAAGIFTKKLLVSPAKTALCLQTARREAEIIARSRPEYYSLYISIPFCPSRCAYCSFVSHSIAGAKKLTEPYVKLLQGELAATAAAARARGLKLQTVYIGGGTPTALTAEQLEAVMSAVKEHFDLSTVQEYTLEAGRPDTFTPQKLAVIQAGKADRISINPQSMNDATLAAIGRRHTEKETREAFLMARQGGFNHINMDVICGLPGETLPDFSRTLHEVLALSPESITIHTLCIKHSSAFDVLAEGGQPGLASAMLDHGIDLLAGHGFAPYYLYRQSKSRDNLENIGFAKPGYESLYNVYIMDETHSILGCGAGAVTKLRQPHGPWIERIFNFKYPYEYIDRFEQILERKRGIAQFYETYPI